MDHYTYVFCGDGDLMEGVSHEAGFACRYASLGKIIYFYDDNLVSLDGPTDLSFTEDVTERFEGYHWHVQFVDDGNDLEEISQAIKLPRRSRQPSLIRVRTVIGYGSRRPARTRRTVRRLAPKRPGKPRRN